MAFNLRFLQPMGGMSRSGMVSATDPGKNAKAGWIYSSPDAVATVVAAGYFNQVRDLLNPNDSILIGSTSKGLRWTSVLASPRSPSIANVTISGKDQDAS